VAFQGARAVVWQIDGAAVLHIIRKLIHADGAELRSLFLILSLFVVSFCSTFRGGLPREQSRVYLHPVGDSFGGKMEAVEFIP
jgi:hypothetical protein